MDQTELFKRRVALNKRKDEAKAVLADINASIRSVDALILKSMDETGTQKMTIDGYTVFDDQRLSVKVLDAVGLRDAAATLGIENMLSMNANTLRGYVREAFLYDDRLDELVIQDDRLPECLRGVISMEESRTVKLRKA